MAIIVTIPVLIGMVIRNFVENFIFKNLKLIEKLTGILFLIVFTAIWIEETRKYCKLY